MDHTIILILDGISRIYRIILEEDVRCDKDEKGRLMDHPIIIILD